VTSALDMHFRTRSSVLKDDATSASFKHYVVQDCLGEGGFGQVFAAWDSKLQRRVALKRLKRSGTPHASQDLLREASLSAALRHPAFVSIYSVEDDADSQAIIMELVEGDTLKQLLGAGPLAVPAAVDIVRQAAEAMREAHRQGLVHGDLKPSNIMLERSGKVRILDFGLGARAHPDATTTDAIADPQGTIAYMAPELLSGAGATAQSDIYALGVVLYELVTGHRPFHDLNGLALAASIVQSSSMSWDYPAELAPVLVQAIQRMTARQPEQRALPISASGAAAIVGDTARSMLPRRPRRWRRAVLPALAAGVMLVGLAGLRHWPSAAARLPLPQVPYSTSREMAAGLAALRLYDRPGELDVAAKHFGRILQAEPEHAGAMAGMSLMYARRHQSEHQDEIWLRKASAAAQGAIRIDDHLALAQAADGVALVRAGKSKAALDRFASALRLEPDNLFALLGRVSALLALRRYDEALAEARHGLAVYPDERSFADLMGRVHFEQGHYAEAEAAFRHSLRIQPDAVYAYASLNAALQRQGRAGEAMRVLQRGLEVRPNAWLYGNLGNALFEQGDYPGAVEAFENAVSPTKGNPNDYLNWANLADALQWIPGRESQAREAYRRACALLEPQLGRAPDDVTLASRMALYIARSGEPARARALIERALAQAPGSLDVQFRAALVFELTGDRERAIAALVSARKLGYPASAIDAEPDLVALRRDPRYRQP
jgi:tetratricopeptide (TPR) repeat protein